MNPLPQYTTRDAAETMRLGMHLGKTLRPGDAVYLFGELGAGKTHLIKGIAKGLSIRSLIKSPTYTFHKSYVLPPCIPPIPGGKNSMFYHYDLYRLHAITDIQTIGYFETIGQPNAIHAVEWAERLEGQLSPRRIEVYLEAHEGFHTIRLHRVSPAIVPKEQVAFFYDEFETPVNIRQHCQAVACVAMQVAETMMRKFKMVNTDSLWSAALLHDMVRWHERPGGKNHAELAADILHERGYTETAATILTHYTPTLIEHPDWFDTIEKKILYYADKRVMHDQVVSVQERFADGRKRWFKKITPALERSFRALEKATLKLEREFF